LNNEDSGLGMHIASLDHFLKVFEGLQYNRIRNKIITATFLTKSKTRRKWREIKGIYAKNGWNPHF
jgi:hypothetical protein